MTTTAFLGDVPGLKYLWLIPWDFKSISWIVLYIILKYSLEFSARALDFWSLTVATSFMALVICSVLSILDFLRLMSLMVAMLCHLPYLAALHSSMAFLRSSSVSGFISFVSRMLFGISGYFVSIYWNSSFSNARISLVGISRRYFFVAA